jgi:hypothetical protein
MNQSATESDGQRVRILHSDVGNTTIESGLDQFLVGQVRLK